MQQVKQGSVRRPIGLKARPLEHPALKPDGTAKQLVDQPRLTNTRLTVHQNDAAASRPRRLERSL
jgi:hypothetical protein